jgi:hypothetical protein
MEKVKQTVKSLMPSGEDLKKGGIDLSGIALGMIGGHVLLVVTKKDNLLLNAGLTVGGFGLAVKTKQPFVRALGLGLAGFGLLKMANHGIKAVAAPGTTEGLNGILPESAKLMIRKFLPTLSGVEGTEENVAGSDDDMGDLLEDFSTRGTYVEPMASSATELEGLGELLELVA